PAVGAGERQRAERVGVDAVAAVVHEPVVVPAQQGQVVQVGGPAVAAAQGSAQGGGDRPGPSPRAQGSAVAAVQ
ncbi:MAG: hypothetical protein M3N17_06340, partial [Actinomycetota bacterium]|nr:hypothetical protein [Actinomycetota bacterium]